MHVQAPINRTRLAQIKTLVSQTIHTPCTTLERLPSEVDFKILATEYVGCGTDAIYDQALHPASEVWGFRSCPRGFPAPLVSARPVARDY